MSTSIAKTYKKITSVVCSLLLLASAVVAVSVATTQTASAQDPAKNTVCPEGYSKNLPNLADADPNNDEPCVPAKLKNSGDAAIKGECKLDCLLRKYVDPFTKLLAALVGVVSAISLVYGGIQFASSAGDPGKVQAARQRITNTVLALLAFLFMFGFLQWLVPGGIF